MYSAPRSCARGSEIFKSGESDPVGRRAFESRFRAAGCLCVSVVNQRYDPEVQCPGGFLGNNVLMRCNVPSFVRDHVTITSWLQEPSFNIYPSTMGGERAADTSGLSSNDASFINKNEQQAGFPLDEYVLSMPFSIGCSRDISPSKFVCLNFLLFDIPRRWKLRV